jgi:hypothetical protein
MLNYILHIINIAKYHMHNKFYSNKNINNKYYVKYMNDIK